MSSGARVGTLALILLAVAATAAQRRGGMEPRIVHYSGAIDAEHNRRFFASLGGAPADRIVVTSGGGEVDAAMALGRWIFEHEVDVEVAEYCLSSCANYIFPAGNRKIIRAGAVVAWHGNYHHLKVTGGWRDDVTARMKHHGEDARTAEQEVHRQVERLVRMERQFFRRIGVDQYVCWVGKMPPYSVPNYYFLSRDDMARFGITDVHVPPAYEQTDVSGLGVAIEHIDLKASAWTPQAHEQERKTRGADGETR